MLICGANGLVIVWNINCAHLVGKADYHKWSATDKYRQAIEVIVMIIMNDCSLRHIAILTGACFIYG